MGISGHILGPRKLRQLRQWSALPFDRAYRYHQWGAGRIVGEAGCRHYVIDFTEKIVTPDPAPTHWFSCPQVIPQR